MTSIFTFLSSFSHLKPIPGSVEIISLATERREDQLLAVWSQSPFNKVLWWALFMKQNLRFGPVLLVGQLRVRGISCIFGLSSIRLDRRGKNLIILFHKLYFV